MFQVTAGDAHTLSLRWDEKLKRLEGFIKSLGRKESELQVLRDLLTRIEQFRQGHPIDAKGTSLSREACKELAELGFQIESAITRELGIKFEDREDELSLVTARESHHRDETVWLLDAPARYGKTFFIYEVMRWLKSKDRKANWKIYYFSFKEYPGTAEDQKAFLEAFRWAFDPDFTGLGEDPSIEQLRNRLAADLSNQDFPLAIFLDDAELVTEKSMVTWLKELLADIRRRHKATGKRFLGLVAGRYITPTWYDINQVSPLRFDKIYIGSLGLGYTQDMIARIADRFKISGLKANVEARETSARIVQMIGAGCPECTINLLIDVGRDTAFNPPEKFMDPERSRALFQQHAAPVCEQVLQDIKHELTQAYYPYLCILRRFSIPLLTELMPFLQAALNLKPVTATDPQDMMRYLNRSGLVQNDINRAFQGDDNIRQLFGLQKWLFESGAAQKINAWAMGFFDKQITEKKGSTGIRHNREALIEYLYHFVLHMRSSSTPKEEAARAFSAALAAAHSRLKDFSPRQDVEPEDWHSQEDELLDTLKKDVEIRSQISHFGISPEEYEKLCSLP